MQEKHLEKDIEKAAYRLKHRRKQKKPMTYKKK